MLKKLGKMLTNNISLKLLAVFFAVILWLVVVNIDDPPMTKKMTGTVTLENVDYLNTLEKCYEVLEDSTNITFSISAKRSILDSISVADFSVRANMERIEYNEKEGVYQIPITITASRYASQITVTSQTQYVVVELEDMTQKKVMITANTKGTVAEGCALGEVAIETTNVINISGPESIVNSVETAVATINVDGMTTDVTDNVIPELFDKDGNVVDTSKLTLSVDAVAVSVDILNTKSVGIDFQTMGEPEEGYVVTDIEYSPETVAVKGEAVVLNTIDMIDIPQEALDISGMKENLVKEIDISTYLPEGVFLVDQEANKISVTVHIEQRVTVDYDVPVANLTLTNVASAYDAKFEVDTVKVTVSGLASDMEKLNVSDIKGVVDASGLTAGTHMVQVTWNLDSEIYTIKTDVTASVKLEEKTTSSGTGDGTGTSSGNGTTTGTGTGTSSGTGTSTGTTGGDGSDSDDVNRPEGDGTSTGGSSDTNP